MSSLYQYLGNENYQPVKSPVASEVVKGSEDDDATPTADNSKRRNRSVVVEIPIGSDPDLWVGSELQVTRTDSTISNEEITLDGSSRRSSRGSGSELGADDLSSVEVGEVSSNEDLETSSSDDSSISFGIKYNNYSAKRTPPKKPDEPDFAEVKDLGFYTLGIATRPGDRTHRSYVQLGTPTSHNGAAGDTCDELPVIDVTETSSDLDGQNGGLWREIKDDEEAEQIVKKSEEKFAKKRKAGWILLVVLLLAIVAVAVVVGVTQSGKNDGGTESSVKSQSAPTPSTVQPTAPPRLPTYATKAPIRKPSVSPTAPPSSTEAAPPTEPITPSPTPLPSRTATQAPSVLPTPPPSQQATQSPTSATPGPSAATAAPSGATPAPSAATPAPSAATPAPSAATPAPSAATPAPSAATPAPTSPPPTLSPSSSPVPNGICSGAYGPLQTNAAVELGTTAGSTTNSISSCGNTISETGVWYTVVGTGEIFNASTCNESTNYQARLSIFTGSCDSLACVDANYNGYQAGTCQDGASTISWMSQPQVLYFIFLYGDGGATGSFGLEIKSTPSTTYASCNTTTTVLPSDGSVSLVTTMGADLVDAGSCGAATKEGYGVWFYISGTGSLITADTCNSGSTLDTAISIFTGSCDVLSCVAGNDDFCGVQSSISWNSTAGQMYHILVVTYSVTGSFGLTVTSA